MPASQRFLLLLNHHFERLYQLHAGRAAVTGVDPSSLHRPRFSRCGRQLTHTTRQKALGGALSSPLGEPVVYQSSLARPFSRDPRPSLIAIGRPPVSQRCALFLPPHLTPPLAPSRAAAITPCRLCIAFYCERVQRQRRLTSNTKDVHGSRSRQASPSSTIHTEEMRIGQTWRRQWIRYGSDKQNTLSSLNKHNTDSECKVT